MGQKGQEEALMSPGSGPEGVAVFPQMRSQQDNHHCTNDATLLEPKGNLSEDTCDPDRSMAGQIPLRNVYDIGTCLARCSKENHPWPMPPEDKAANLGS